MGIIAQMAGDFLITGWLLTIGITTPHGILKIDTVEEVTNGWYMTQSSCEFAKQQDAVQESYKNAFPNDEVKMWCEPILEPKRKHFVVYNIPKQPKEKIWVSNDNKEDPNKK